MNLQIGETFNSIVDVMNRCFGRCYKACFKGRYWLDKNMKTSAWFPKITDLSKGTPQNMGNGYGWCNTISDDGRTIYTTNIKNPNLINIPIPTRREPHLTFVKMPNSHSYKYVGVFVLTRKYMKKGLVYERIAEGIDTDDYISHPKNKDKYGNDIPDQVIFYVSEFLSDEKYVALDFVRTEDYEYVLRYPRLEIDVDRLSRHFVKPSRIRIKKCKPQSLTREDVIIQMPMETFLHLAETSRINRDADNSSDPFLTLMTFDDGREFAKTIDDVCTIRNVKEEDYVSPNYIRENGGSLYDLEDASSRKELITSLTSVMGPIWNDLENEDEVKMWIWNVQQANSNGLISKQSALLFDLGAPSKSSPANINIIFNRIYKFYKDKYFGLMISHWDEDHINQLLSTDLLSTSFLDKIKFIIFPFRIIKKPARDALDILLSKCPDRCIPILPPLNIPGGAIAEVWDNDPIFVYIGKRRTSINNSGLILHVRRKDASGLFTGDREQWKHRTTVIAAGRTPLLHNIVVPHHGGDIPVPKTNDIPSIAAVSVGKNGHKHPNINTLDDYSINHHYDVKRTDAGGGVDIEIDI